VHFSAAKDGGNASVTNVNMTITNSGPQPLADFVFQAAVPKYMKMQMQPASSSTVPPNGAGVVTQLLKLANSMQGQKPIVIRIKIEYSVGGSKVSETGEVANFPPNF
jgi:AP-1 complex subunit gamma-1